MQVYTDRLHKAASLYKARDLVPATRLSLYWKAVEINRITRICRLARAIFENASRFSRKNKRELAATGVFYTLTSVALVGPLFCQTASMTVSLLQDGYNLIVDAVSNLVFGPYGWLQTAVFVVFGVSVLCLDAVLLSRLKIKNAIGAISLALIGTGFFIIALVPGQAPGGAATLATTVHNCATGMVVVMFPTACLSLSPTFKALRYRKLYIGSIITGIIMGVFMVAGGLTLGLRYNMVGIYERILLWSGQLFVMAVCLHLLKDKRLGLRQMLRQKTALAAEAS